MKLNPKISLLIVAAIYIVIFGIIGMALLWYFVAFIVGLASKCGAWVLFLGAICLTFSTLKILALHNK